MNRIADFLNSFLAAIKLRGLQNAEAIKTFHDCKAGERGAFGRPDVFGRAIPNRHARNRQPPGYYEQKRDPLHFSSGERLAAIFAK